MLKTPLFQKLPLSKDSSYIFERYVSPIFETPWHYHEEIEIVTLDHGHGQKIIGNHISEYNSGDLFLFGSNLPHWFRADDGYYNGTIEDKPSSIVIQFKYDSFGLEFFNIREMAKVRELFEKSKNGIEFFGDTKKRILAIMQNHNAEEGLQRLRYLLEILDIMIHSKEFRTVSDIAMVKVSPKDSERMNIVIDYIFNKFKEDIDLNVLADKVGMSTAAFCRYFKSRTHKTFVEYLNETKISHACKLLRDTDMPIIDICYDSGFNNLSNFNRQFRKITNQNPQTYRKSMD
ncbi:MAG: AraC family transcriptional regulator [Leadbetterella sp.]